MPPGTAYNWLCVIHGAVDILSHAARHRATQVTPQAVASYANPRKRRRTDTELDSEAAEAVHRYYEPRGANERSAQVVPESLAVEMKGAQIGGKTYDAPLPPIRRLDKLEIVKDSTVLVSSGIYTCLVRVLFYQGQCGSKQPTCVYAEGFQKDANSRGQAISKPRTEMQLNFPPWTASSASNYLSDSVDAFLCSRRNNLRSNTSEGSSSILSCS